METRVCTKCAETKPLSEFRKNKKAKTGYDGACSVCLRKAQTAWRRANPKMRAWKAANAARFRATNRRYQDEHPDQYRAHRRKYWKRHPELWLNYSNERRARKNNAPVVERISRKRVIARDRSICWLCGEYCPPDQLTLDHVIPLCKGGDHTEANLAVAHGRCNSIKGARILSGAAPPSRTTTRT